MSQQIDSCTTTSESGFFFSMICQTEGMRKNMSDFVDNLEALEIYGNLGSIFLWRHLTDNVH